MRISVLFGIIVISQVFLSCDSDDGSEAPIDDLVYPSYGTEVAVTINNLSFDAMEPFISPDGNYLFFNNLNDGINTKLYYASRINDSTFNFLGELEGANQTAPPHLDAVADLDINGNFYWTSTRNYPVELNNLFRGSFDGSIVTDIERVEGDFNMNIPGWLVMDHGISLNGEFLYFNNARFNDMNCIGPCETVIGIARKNADATFSTLQNSQEILQNINDPNYIYYAPCISSDNKEFYYTRYLKGEITPKTIIELCVAVRGYESGAFSIPKVLFSETVVNIIEASTLTTDKSIMYYHKKVNGIHKIMMRHRML